MTKVKMSIEWDNSITEVSDTDKTNCEYCEINITNTFKKFAMTLGGEHLWNKIVDKIAENHGYKKPNYNETANEPMLEDYCDLKEKEMTIEELEKENERLKGEVDFLSMRRDNFCDAMEELVENGAVDTFDWTGGLVILAKDTNYEYLRKENAKLHYALARLRWEHAHNMETMIDQLYTERPSSWRFYYKSKTYWFNKCQELKKALREKK